LVLFNYNKEKIEYMTTRAWICIAPKQIILSEQDSCFKLTWTWCFHKIFSIK